MRDDIPAALLDIGALPLPDSEVQTCPPCVECGAPCDPVRSGILTACVQCSTRPLGEHWPALAYRVSHHLTLGQWNKLETVHDIPPLRYSEWRKRVWLTPGQGRGTQ